METVDPPASLAWRDLEQECLFAVETAEKSGRPITMGRYGVQAVVVRDKTTGAMTTQVMQSLPDFEGVVGPRGRQFVFDAKVCSKSSLSLNDSTTKERQLRHMLRRSRCGAACGLLVHFNRRELKQSTVPAQTWLFPVHFAVPFWERVTSHQERSIGLTAADEYGIAVEWWLPPRGRRPRLLLEVALQELLGRVDELGGT